MPNGWVIDFMIMMKTRLVYQLYFWKGQKNGFREFVRNSRLKITSYISIRLCIMTEIKPFTLNLDAWNKNNIGFEWIDFNLWWYYTLTLYRIQQFHISTLHFFIYTAVQESKVSFFLSVSVLLNEQASNVYIHFIHTRSTNTDNSTGLWHIYEHQQQQPNGEITCIPNALL